MQPLKHKAVNWIDGMKISKEHLIQQEAFFTDSLRDAASMYISKLNYGLLSPVTDSGKSINIKILVDSSKVIRVHLLECHAVTSTGERIEIVGDNAVKINSDADKLTADYDFTETKEKTFYAVLSVNLFARNPAGKPDPDEIPPRYPHTVPHYRVEVLPESQISNSQNSVLIIGKLQMNAGRMMVLDKFIPPCALVRNHPLLLETYYTLGNQLGETANLNLSIVQKAHAKSQTTSLIKSFMTFSEKVSDFLADNLGRFMWMVSDMPPVYLIENFIRFSYVIKFALERMTPKDKEELLTYFSDWTDMTVPEISEKISAMLLCEYNHDDIAQSLRTAEEFMFTVFTIFTKLNGLDFIGKKKNPGAFVTERPSEKEVEVLKKDQKRNWSFLADDERH